MDNQFPLYLIPLLPIAGAVLNLAFGRRFGKSFVVAIGCTTVAGAMLLAWIGAFRLWGMPDWQALHDSFFAGDWFYASEKLTGQSIHIRAGLLLDRLSATMILVVTTVGFLIHVYSTAYMAEDEGFHRYFAYLNLFTGAMLILVLGDSLPVTFVGWEGVGLCSYLLIGFWFTKEQNAYAGRKAFIVNRIGDFGFLLGMCLLFAAAGTLNYEDLAKPDTVAALRAPFLFGPATYATIAGLLLFVGCTGKSAQLPLYVWLPDAMAGPTPVSALIHAATMVTAGVYLIARLHLVFELDPFVLGVIATVGAITALFAATMGITARPIKKVLAYSTVSQLGFMFIGVGTKAFSAGLFHLVTHAFFKAGLFLGAGSIMHAMGGEEDIFRMGGLGKKLPATRWTFLIYCLAIAGIFPFAGFFSKDAILAGAFVFDDSNPRWPHWLGPAIYVVGLVAALCTAFYMFRAYFLVFHGKFRGTDEEWHHVHESPPEMTWPLVILAAGAVGLGFLGLPSLGGALEHWSFLEHWLPTHLAVAREPEHLSSQLALMGIATAVALAGIGIAWRLYGNTSGTAEAPSPVAANIAKSAGGLYRLVSNKYWVDEIYDTIIVRPLRKVAWFLWKVIDAFLIDLVLVRGSAVVVDSVGRTLRYVQNGDAQRYLLGLVVGAAAILLGAAWWPARSATQFDVETTGNEVTVRIHPGPAGAPRPFEYTFDFGDGTEPLKQAGTIARHHYDSTGKKKILVEVRDPRWNTHSSRARTVEIK